MDQLRLAGELIGIGLKGKYRGQTQRWYAFRFEGSEDEIAINPPPGGNEAEFDQWAWMPMQDLPGLIVPFKREFTIRLLLSSYIWLEQSRSELGRSTAAHRR